MIQEGPQSKLKMTKHYNLTNKVLRVNNRPI